MVKWRELSKIERDMRARWMVTTFLKIWKHMRYPMCTENIRQKIMDKVTLMIMTRGVVRTRIFYGNKRHWFRWHPHSMQAVSSSIFSCSIHNLLTSIGNGSKRTTSRIMHRFIGPKFRRIGLRNISDGHLWYVMKPTIYAQDQALANIKKLWTTINKAWLKICPEVSWLFV